MFIARICNLFRENDIPFAVVGGYAVAMHGVAWNFMHPTRMRDSLDIVITDDMRDFEIIEVESDFGKIPTLSLDSLILMKSRLNREQDQKDVAALRSLRQQKP